MPELKYMLRSLVGKCEFYPSPGTDCVCDCGSDVSGRFVCTVVYSKTCQWANKRREELKA